MTITPATTQAEGAREVDARALAALAAGTVLLRLLLFAIVSWRTGATLLDFAESTDGGQYLLAAKSWLVGPQLLDADPSVRRLFPGVPLLVAGLWALGLPPAWAALLPSWLAATAAAVLAAWWARDLRVGWAMACLPPIYLYASALISTETVAVALSLAGVLLCERRRSLAGGLALGLAIFCRPFALFAALGAAVGQLVQRRWREAAWTSTGIAVAGTAGLLALQLSGRDPLMSARTYHSLRGGILAWPFENLLLVPWRSDVPSWKVPYVWAHALVALLALALAVVQLRKAGTVDERARAATVVVWLGGLLAFTVSLTTAWAFHDFPRFIVPALPPLYLALRRFLPRSRLAWSGLAAASLVLALHPALRYARVELGPGSSVEALWGVTARSPRAPAP